MADISNVVVPVAAGATVNIIAKMKSGRITNAVEVVFSNVALFAGLAAIGQFLDWELAGLLALLYFISTMFTSGLPVIDWFTELVGG